MRVRLVILLIAVSGCGDGGGDSPDGSVDGHATTDVAGDRAAKTGPVDVMPDEPRAMDAADGTPRPDRSESGSVEVGAASDTPGDVLSSEAAERDAPPADTEAPPADAGADQDARLDVAAAERCQRIPGSPTIGQPAVRSAREAYVTTDAGLLRFDGVTFTAVPGPPGGKPTSVALGPDGIPHVMAAERVWRRTGDGWTALYDTEPVFQGRPLSLHSFTLSPAGILYVVGLTFGGDHSYRVSAGSWAHLGQACEYEAFGGSDYTIRIDASSGRLVAVCGNASWAMEYDDAKWTRLGRSYPFAIGNDVYYVGDPSRVRNAAGTSPHRWLVGGLEVAPRALAANGTAILGLPDALSAERRDLRIFRWASPQADGQTIATLPPDYPNHNEHNVRRGYEVLWSDGETAIVARKDYGWVRCDVRP